MLETMQQVWDRLAQLTPRIALVLGVLLLGLLAAVVLRRVTRWAVRRVGLEELGERAGISKTLYALGIRRGLASFLGQVVFYTVLLITFSALAELLGLDALAELGSTLTRFLPRALAAVLVLVGGLWLAGWLRGLVLRFGERGERLESPALVAQVVYYAVLVVAITLAAQQAGLDTDLITLVIGIAVGGLVFGFALMFALSARGIFQNIIARHYCQSSIRPGDEVEVEGMRGRVLRYTAVSVVLTVDDGKEKLVPCSALIELPVVLHRRPQ
ncbi:MAG: mechanosensitive ion channel [Myxococcales bacterium]|nr:mechanosensitive ion channel [Myxococcales bacterium]